MKKITLKLAFEELLKNSELAEAINIKEEYLNKEIEVNEVEEFVSEMHRNSLILYNKVYDMK